jgi:hypothetical protein
VSGCRSVGFRVDSCTARTCFTHRRCAAAILCAGSSQLSEWGDEASGTKPCRIGSSWALPSKMHNQNISLRACPVCCLVSLASQPGSASIQASCLCRASALPH